MTVDEIPTPPPADDEGWGRNRRKAISDVDLAPESLVSSWFRRFERERSTWQGVVVGEIQPGVYLLDIEAGRSRYQRVVSLRSMLGDDADDGYEWRFYDSEEAMRAGYAEFLAHGEEVT